MRRNGGACAAFYLFFDVGTSDELARSSMSGISSGVAPAVSRVNIPSRHPKPPWASAVGSQRGDRCTVDIANDVELV